jgi:hypothetical protein
MAIKKVFKSLIPSVNYVTQRGRTCVFQEGRFLTDVPEEIAELTQTVIDKSNPHIYIDPNESEFDTTLQEKLIAAQKEAALRVLAEHNAQKAGADASNQQSQGAQVPQETKTVTPATLLGVTTSATLGGMSKQSNQK